MDPIKAVERIKYNLEIEMNVYKQLCDDNVPPPLMESHEAVKLALAALEKQIAIPVIVRRRERHSRSDYFCPVCNKQQKYSYKNLREGCFCERCGQRLSFPEVYA